VRRKVAAGIAVVVIALIAAWWWHGHHASRTDAQAAAASHAGDEASRASTHRGPQAPATLSGTITSKAGGAPIAGAIVSIAKAELTSMMIPGQSPTLVATSSPAGTWTIAIPPGTYIVAATARGFFPGQTPRIVVIAGEQHGGVDLALEAGGTLVHGTVTDFGGGPIAGARVTLRDKEDFSFEGKPDFVAITGQDGTYQLTVRDGSYRAEAAHDDYRGEGHSIEVKGKPVIQDFKLVPGAVIRGRVVARDSKAGVPGAWIDVRGARSHSFGLGGDTVSDQDGNFVVRSLSSGALSLRAAGPGYASAAPTVVEVGIGEQIDGIIIVVDRAFTISGKVVAKSDPKKPLPGIVVGGFSIVSQQAAVAHDPSDSEGRFEIVGVRPATYTIGAFGEGNVPDIEKTPVEVVDKDITGIVVELDKGVTVSGRVDPPGRASVGLTIDGEIGLANMFEMAKTVVVHADADPTTGAFTLKNVPSGKLIITAKTEDGSAGKQPVTVTDVDQQGVVVALETRASISGTVVDTNGNPAVGANVNANNAEHKPSFSPSFHDATVAADGTFKIVGLESGKVIVTASWDYADRWKKDDKDKPPAPIELGKGEQRTGVKLTVEARDGVIRGEVIGSDRKSAPDAWITVFRDRGKDDKDNEGESWAIGTPVLTNADGKFTIDHLSKGTYTLVADGPRGASRVSKSGVQTGDTVTLELAPLGTLAGHVTNRSAPVAVYDLHCRGPVGPVDRRITAADGGYALEHLAPGSYSCSVSADGGTATGAVDVPGGDAKLDFTLVPWASVTGVVVSVLSGAPVPGITVIAGGFQGRGMQDVLAGTAPVTDASGRFTVGQVAAGSGSIVLMPPTGGFDQLATRTYTASDGQHVDLGTIKIVPPRNGEAGTFGLVAAPKDGKLAVVTVAPGGPAEQAGITTADVITQLDGHAVADIGLDSAASLLSSGRIATGAQVTLTLERGATVQLTAATW
jgi:protocatechuate 3,4-dioxygenase beta subunit